MKVNYGVPQKFADVLKNDTYYGKNLETFSVTDMLKDVKPVVLKKRHGDKIEYEIEDRLWSFFGTAFHTAMEKSETDTDLAEEFLQVGKLRGKFDHYDSIEKAITDFKFTSVWSMVYNDGFLDYHKQLSFYAAMLKENGFDVETCRVLLIFRDWKNTEYKRGKYDVPKPYATIDFGKPLTEIDGLPILEYAEKKINYFKSMIDSDSLPDCSEEYRWAKPDTYAVMKGKNIRAFRVFDSIEQANELAETDDIYRVEVRTGNKFVRCEYCDVKEYCEQWKEK